MPGGRGTIGAPVIRAAAPPGGARWRAESHVDEFHLFVVGRGGIQEVDTKFGMSKVVHCDAIIAWNVDGKAVRYDSQPVFGAVLVGQLGQGGHVAGTIGQGVAQPGRNAPWMILEATPEQLDWVRNEWASLHDADGGWAVPLAEPEAQIGEPF